MATPVILALLLLSCSIGFLNVCKRMENGIIEAKEEQIKCLEEYRTIKFELIKRIRGEV